MNIKQSLVLCLAMTSASMTFADDFKVGRINYTTTSDTEAKLVKGDDAVGAVNIPSSVSYGGRAYDVTAIEHNAFENNKAITSVTIPASVTSMGYSAFNSCDKLETVVNNGRMTQIESWTFTNCTALASVTFPETVKVIGDHAFKNTGLTSVFLPEGVEEVGDWAFEACKDLTYVQLPTSVSTLKDGTFFQCEALRSIVIPASVTAIYNNVFNGCRQLSAVYYLGNAAPNVSEYTFADVASDFAVYVKPSAVGAVRTMAYVGDRVTDQIPYSQAHDLSSFSRGFGVDFTDAKGLTAYVAEVYNQGRRTVTIQSVDNAAAGTGLVIQAEPGKAYQLRMADGAMTYDNNLLRAAVGPVYLSQAEPARTKEASLGALELTTDKAIYDPSSPIVTFTATGTLPQGAKVRYLHGSETVGTAVLTGNSWTWTAPADDHRGYLAEVYTEEGDTDRIHATIGIDVSSSWARFPRYGFLSDYGADRLQNNTIQRDVDYLNRLHINGVQFYDWQWQHHKLWKDEGDRWYDFAGREVVKQTVKDYISQLHGIGAKCMFYDLCYGATGAKVDGEPVKPDFLEKDGLKADWGWCDWHQVGDTQDYKFRQARLDYDGPKWPSIYLMDPGNKDWQNYLAAEVGKVYENLDFDGFHIDQVGEQRHSYYHKDNDGKNYGMTAFSAGFASFINSMKAADNDKLLVMNAVSNYGSSDIVGTHNVEFGYHEMWDAEDYYKNYRDVIQKNKRDSGDPLFNTVFAAYVHHRRGGEWFNTPAVLLGDATIFALGGAHIELSGDHMLPTEYFPDNYRKMTDELQKSIVSYYDFLTGYENFLRDGGNETSVDMTIDGMKVKAWEPEMGYVTTYSKLKGNKTIIQVLNYSQASSLTVRDLNQDMPEPTLVTDRAVTLDDAEPVNRVWVATPDAMGGSPQELRFTQEDGKVRFTLPSLKYWTMVVVEHGPAAALQGTQAKTYVLKDGEFRVASAGWIPAGKAYIQLSSSLSESLAKILTIDFSGVTNGLHSSMMTGNASADDSYYSLSGMKVRKPSKGVFVHKGKKVVMN
ncbi:MAG: leucine-rich repeat protein [Prevotella sp.]|nr:leucine-rich repeat protein [Prevotella sp.]